MNPIERGMPQDLPTSAFMHEEDFTPEMLRNISILIKALARGNASRIIGNMGEEFAYNEIIESWDKHYAPFEYRVGSLFGLDSKLWFARKPRSLTANMVEVWFNAGLDVNASEDTQEQARNMELQFAQALQERIGPTPQLEF